MRIKLFEIVKIKNFHIVLGLGGFRSLMGFAGGVFFYGSSRLSGKCFKQFIEKIQLPIYFPERLSPEHFERVKYLLPETTGGINEKVTEETTYKNFSNATLFPVQQPILPEELDELKSLFKNLLSSGIDPADLEQSIALAKLKKRIQILQGYLVLETLTGKL